ncbi:hypothetical protein B0H63DRAFT_475676 [Podospora didyma]|uniref:CST complex subunit STN1 n=1 Tax=Podospora didyma TaxID=330526 RepID=A0AAE0TVX3_9PEZI|nr:hypothetical protein B0H63DRAFT_475676 [Podospora didyma]
MPGAGRPALYPHYCIPLSPTVNRWCHLRVADIFALESPAEFRGHGLFFYTNHPIKWVRIAGVVVAIDELEGRRIYTIDDSSGATIECVANVAQPFGSGTATGVAPSNSTRGAETYQPQIPLVDGDIDIGHVVDVKGGIKIFRGSRQIQADKIGHLRSTEQEVQFWERITSLRNEILDRPWVLDKKEVRRCQRESDHRHSRHTGIHKRNISIPAATAQVGPHRESSRRPERIPPATALRPSTSNSKVRKSGLEGKAKLATKKIITAGRYDALGL